MFLPHSNRAIVDVEKLSGYCLNPDHPLGKHKARVFEASLGMTSEDAEVLRSLILTGIRQGDCFPGVADQYGERYVVDFLIQWNGLEALIRTIWIIRASEKSPRLRTCYLK